MRRAWSFAEVRIRAPSANLVIAPDGWKGSDDKRGWNDCRADAATNPPTDDVGLIGALIDKAIADYDADPARVYIFGFGGLCLGL